MESAGQFERLVRMVQETGERVVVSLEKGKDPVVLLPLTAFEKLLRQRDGEGVGFLPVPDASSPNSVPVVTIPEVSSGDSVDVWDGEMHGDDAGEYDAERIFAEIDRQSSSVSTTSSYPTPRSPLKHLVGDPSRSAILSEPERRVQGETRFSLGMG